MSDPGLYQGDVPIANWTDPDRLVPTPVGQPDGKMLTVASDALVYGDAPDLTAVKGFVEHGAVAATPRPVGFASVEWLGTVEPDNWVNGDTWLDAS